MIPRPPRSRARRLTAAGAVAALALPLVSAGTASAYPAPGGQRDVREFACSPAQVSDNPFGDVSGFGLFTLEIRCLADYGITQGDGRGNFSPGADVSRAQMALFLSRLLEHVGYDLDATRTAPFTDLDDVLPEVRASVDRLAEYGITQGTTATTFSPGASVTREQMAAFLVRLHGYLVAGDVLEVAPLPEGDDAFDDDDDGSAFADEIDALAAARVVVGDGSGRFLPGRPITRGQMAAFLTRYLDLLAEEEPALAPPRDNEALSTGFAALARPEIGVGGGQSYTVGGLTPFVPYTVWLVDPRAYEQRPVDVDADPATPPEDVLFFRADQSPEDPGVARPDPVGAPATPATITAVEGQRLPTTGNVVAGRVVPVVAPADGELTFTVESPEPVAVAPFVFPSVGDKNYNFFLELAEDLRPVEVFGVGPVTTFIPAQV